VRSNSGREDAIKRVIMDARGMCGHAGSGPARTTPAPDGRAGTAPEAAREASTETGPAPERKRRTPGDGSRTPGREPSLERITRRAPPLTRPEAWPISFDP
jgi:hypothetical protein